MSSKNEYEYTNPIPLMSEDLIKELARDIPALRLHPIADSMSSVWFKAGARDLVETLLERLKQTNIAQLEGDITVNV